MAGGAGAGVALLLAAEYENLLRCIRCGLCLPVCPTYQETAHETESPRGRIAMARAFVEGHLSLTADLQAHQESCLLCDACSSICPTGVKMERIGVAMRADICRVRPAPRLVRAIELTLSNMDSVRLAAGLARAYAASGARDFLRRTGLPARLGLARAERLLPSFGADPLVARGQTWPATGKTRYSVALFVGCVMSTVFAGIDRAAARVLAANGCRVTAVVGQGCCGALHQHNGDVEGARVLARKNVDAFKEAAVDVIVSAAGGCTAMLKGYQHLLAGDAEYSRAAGQFSNKVKDITEFLASIELSARAAAMPLKVTYQDACHLAHAQGIRTAPRALLGTIPRLELVEMEDAAVCCGSAGIYNLRQPKMADALMRRKVVSALATGADVVVSANPGCMLQLEAGLRAEGAKMRVRHVVELLDEAYRDNTNDRGRGEVG